MNVEVCAVMERIVSVLASNPQGSETVPILMGVSYWGGGIKRYFPDTDETKGKDSVSRAVTFTGSHVSVVLDGFRVLGLFNITERKYTGTVKKMMKDNYGKYVTTTVTPEDMQYIKTHSWTLTGVSETRRGTDAADPVDKCACFRCGEMSIELEHKMSFVERL